MSSILPACEQVAGQQARLATLRSETHRLQAQCAVFRDLPQKLERSCQEAAAQARLLDQLGALTPLLLAEGDALVSGWVEREGQIRFGSRLSTLPPTRHY